MQQFHNGDDEEEGKPQGEVINLSSNYFLYANLLAYQLFI